MYFVSTKPLKLLLRMIGSSSYKLFLWWSTGIGYDAKEFSGSFMVDPLIEKSFDVHVARSLSPICQVGAHIRHQTEKQLTSAKVAGSYQYDSQTILKGRLDEKGMVAALLQYSPSPPFATFSLLAEVNCRDLKQKPNIGLSFTVLGAAVTQWSSQLKKFTSLSCIYNYQQHNFLSNNKNWSGDNLRSSCVQMWIRRCIR